MTNELQERIRILRSDIGNTLPTSVHAAISPLLGQAVEILKAFESEVKALWRPIVSSSDRSRLITECEDRWVARRDAG